VRNDGECAAARSLKQNVVFFAHRQTFTCVSY
jgi:hypothetical protein